MQLVIAMDMDNAAFEGGLKKTANGEEMHRIIAGLANNFRQFGDVYTGERGSLSDMNGNKIGKWEVTA